MEENGCLIFVEVRHRSSIRFGGALESIDRRKQSKLRTAARHYLQCADHGAHGACRFDVVLSEPAREDGYVWVRNAF